MPANTATGTIAIHVTDHNDHCPTLTTTHSNLCSNLKTVTVTGFDEDASPYAAPFEFKIVPEGTRGSWDVEVINGKKMFPKKFALRACPTVYDQDINCSQNSHYQKRSYKYIQVHEILHLHLTHPSI